MAKVEVWTKQYGGIAAKRIWVGNMSVVPRIGEYLEIHEGWAGETVESVVHSLFDDSVTIRIRPDTNNAYPEYEVPEHG